MSFGFYAVRENEGLEHIVQAKSEEEAILHVAHDIGITCRDINPLEAIEALSQGVKLEQAGIDYRQLQLFSDIQRMNNRVEL